MEAENDTTLESLRRSCSKIRKRARSWRTISSSSPSSSSSSIRRKQPQHSCNKNNVTGDTGAGVIQQQIGEEEEKAQDLDRAIWEYQSAIGRIKKRRRRKLQLLEHDASYATNKIVTPTQQQQQQQENSTTNNRTPPAKNASQQQQQQRLLLLRSKVMGETLRQQQETLLLSHMATSVPAIRVATARHTPTNDNSNNHNIDDPTEIIVQEAVRCRNNLVQTALTTQQKLDSIKRDLRQAHQRGMELQSSNQNAWNQLQQLRQGQQQDEANLLSLIPSATAEHTGTAGPDELIRQEKQAKMQRLVTEILVLKRALADILLIPQLDWYNDERPRETFLQLE